jgi:hypothetical protein
MKFLAACFIFLMLMVSSAYPQGFQKGEFNVNSQTEGWTLKDGSGSRTYQLIVVFDKPFESAPTVIVNLTGLDATTEKGLRISLKVEKVTTTMFVLKISTWQDSQINGVEGTWLALTK